MVQFKQISSLEKIRSVEDFPQKELKEISLFKGEKYSYQITTKGEYACPGLVTVDTNLGDCVKVYDVKNIVMDKPAEEFNFGGIKNADEDYITKESGIMPDLLMPVEEQKGKILFHDGIATMWVQSHLGTYIFWYHFIRAIWGEPFGDVHFLAPSY